MRKFTANGTIYVSGRVPLEDILRRPNISEDIIPLAKFRARAGERLRRLKLTGRPLVITQRGEPVAVVMSPAEYDRVVEQGEVIARVAAGLRAVEAGGLVPDNEVWKEVDRVIDRVGQEDEAGG